MLVQQVQQNAFRFVVQLGLVRISSHFIKQHWSKQSINHHDLHSRRDVHDEWQSTMYQCPVLGSCKSPLERFSTSCRNAINFGPALPHCRTARHNRNETLSNIPIVVHLGCAALRTLSTLHRSGVRRRLARLSTVHAEPFITRISCAGKGIHIIKNIATPSYACVCTCEPAS